MPSKPHQDITIGSAKFAGGGRSPAFRVTVSRHGGHGLRAHVDAMQYMPNARGYWVGWDTNSRYRRKNGSRITVSRVAKILEFGAPSSDPPIKASRYGPILPRPFFRTANRNYASSMKSLIMAYARSNHTMRTTGKYHLTQTQLNTIAGRHVEHVQREISSGNYTGNTAYTLKHKKSGSTKPLVDTGKMLADVTYEIKRRV